MRIGVDLGGTKIEIVALDPGGRYRQRQRTATPAGDYGRTIRTVSELVQHVETRLGQRGTVGVATPGALSPANGLLRNSNSTCLNGRPLREDLEKMTSGLDETTPLQVTDRDIDEVIASWTGIPVASIQTEEAERLMKMEDSLRRWVVGQDRAIVAIALVPAAFVGLTLEGPTAWDGLLTFWVRNGAVFLWIAVMGVELARVIHRQRREGEEVEAAPA